ncbi:DUF839 domain-containing protein [Paenibacillus sp. LHD-117]|uniref:PhoX family protein n=1 Tax=Paenibacillus sp. LHD-117 TaxID=3071412 RepID=UPI0027E0AD92|nr:alkaline phosphatase PhoX [Paenibacillus sp. LHD-117]MDQ6422912.1 DUF839 domain-containing protein [Paenibacillus sp. LHD-117]
MNGHENNQMSRRKFLGFLGSSAATIAVASTGLGPLVEKAEAAAGGSPAALPFPSLKPMKASELTAPIGYSIDSIQPVGSGGGNLVFMQGASANEGILWVSRSLAGASDPRERGASIIGVKREPGGAWKADKSVAGSRRITAMDRVQLTGPAKGSKAMNGSSVAQGLWSNGSVGRTPWGTVLAGERPDDADAIRAGINPPSYGWIGEADPKDAGFGVRKHTALGRFAHGDATVVVTSSGRIAVYMGGEHALYKFISSAKYDPAKGSGNSALLEDGKLYAANLSAGRWVELTSEAAGRVLADPAYRVPAGVNRLREELLVLLKEQAGVLTNAHEAAFVLGATKLEGAYGVALHPADGSLFVAQRGNDGSGNGHGSILRIVENGNDAEAVAFESDLVVAGGRQAAISSPGALAFDNSGRLWAASGIAADQLHQGAFAAFGSNALYALTPQGESFGQAQAFAYAPGDGAMSLPAFGPSGTLFASVIGADGKQSGVYAFRQL